ncbi:MAG: hypothetical protein R3B13_07370 [Polyangiaceae bacterium]
MRIPQPKLVQLPLNFSGGPQIYIHEGARQALERRLETAHGAVVQLAVTDNRRRMVTRTLHRGSLRVRLHMMFLDAPERVVDALVRYVVWEDPEASALVGEFIDKNLHRIRGVRPVTRVRTRGRVHDLESIFADVNERYFNGAASDALITWGRRTAPRESRTRHSIKLGSYSAHEKLIRVHPCLDREWVPRYFVAYIVYHELLHHLIPAARVGGRAILHSAEFQEREARFAYYQRALDWEQKHIHRLLRTR